MERQVKPLNDFAFKKAMGEPGDEAQLRSFLRAVLSRTGKEHIDSVEIIENKDLPPDEIDGKMSRLDVLAKLAGGSMVNIEVQIKNEYNMAKRSPYYWAKNYIRGIKSGGGYWDLKPVITINIVDFNMFPLEDFHTSFHIWEDRHKDFMLSDVCELHFLDLALFRKALAAGKYDLGDPAQRWLSYLNAGTPVEIVEEVLKMDEGIQLFHGKLSEINRDPELWRAYENYEKTALDWSSSMTGARQEGLQQGMQQGMQQGLQQGMQQGLQQGMQQGMQQGRNEILELLKYGATREELLKRFG